MAIVIDMSKHSGRKEKYWVSYIRQRIRRNKNFLGFISGQTGCLDKDTKIKVIEDNKVVYKKIGELPLYSEVVSYNFKKRKFEFNQATLIKKGIQDCYKITFSDGSNVIATKDHFFFRPNGEEISVEQCMDKKERYSLASKNYPLKNENSFYGKRHPQEFIDYQSRLFYKNGIKVYRKLASKNLKKECAWCGHIDRKLLVHHIDGNRFHNELSNLIYLCFSCHTKYHKKNARKKNK